MRVRSRHSSKKSAASKILLAALIILLLGLVVPSVVTMVSRVVMYPVYSVHTWFLQSSSALPTYLREKKELVDEIHTLKNELAVAVSTDLTQQRLYEENVWLRQLLSATTTDRIAAAVIARPNELPYDLLQIDRGSEDGIVIGAPVYIGADNVIGVVALTAPRFSFVELFTTPGFEATAFISGANVIATVEGYGGGVARVRVPQGIALSVGNVVHVPSIEPGAFGRVSYVENRPSQPEQYGYITFDKAISSINYVAVGTEAIAPATPEKISEEVAKLIRESVKVENIDVMKAEVLLEAASTTATTTENE